MAQKELVDAHRTALNAQNAFLLGISASAIAFTFHSTADRDLSTSTWLILGAACVWAISFAAGIQKGQQHLNSISYNLAILEANRIGISDKAEEGATKFSKTRKRAGFLHSVQLWSLLTGALIFAAGHVAHLAEVEPSSSVQQRLPVRGEPTAGSLPVETNSRPEIEPTPLALPTGPAASEP